VIRQLSHAFALGCLLVLTVTGALYWGLATLPGTQWIVQQARGWLPGFSAARVDGALLGHFRLFGVDYRNALERYHFDRVEWRLDPAELWKGKLHFRKLEFHKPRYVTTDDSPIQWPNLKLPVDLIIDEMKVRDGSLKFPEDEEAQRLLTLDASLSLTRDGLELRKFAWTQPELSADLSGHLAMGGMEKVDLKTHWNWHPKGKPEFRGEGYLGGNLGRMNVHQTLKAPLPATVSAVVLHPFDEAEWTAQLDVPEFEPRLIDPAWPAWPVHVSLQGEGTGDRNARLSVDVQARIPGLGDTRADLQARYRQPGELTVERLDLAIPATKSALKLTGKARHFDREPEFQTVAQWENLNWPLQGTPEWRSPRGQVSVTGTRKQFRFDAAGMLADKAVTASGSLTLPKAERIEFREVRAQGAGLQLQLDGVWGPQLALSWVLQGDQLGAWVPGAQGRISSRGTLSGPREGPAGEVDVSARDFRFRNLVARELTVHGRGGLTPGAPPIEAEASGADLRFGGDRVDRLKLTFKGGLLLRDGRLEMSSPAAHLNFSGQGLQVRDYAARDVEVQASGGIRPDSPPLDARIKGHGLKLGDAAANALGLNFQGGVLWREGRLEFTTPNLALSVEGEGFRYREDSARSLKLEVTGGLTAGAPPVDATLKAEGVRIAGADADRLSVGFKGGLLLRDGRLQPGADPLSVTLDGTGLHYQQASLDAMKLHAGGGLLPGSPPMTGKLEAQGLRSGATTVGSTRLDFAGGLVYRNGTFTMEGQPLAVRGHTSALTHGQRRAPEVQLEFKAGGQPDSPVSLGIKAPELMVDGHQFGLDLQADGTRARHRLTGQVVGNLADGETRTRALRLDLKAEGHWGDTGWSGEIQRFDGSLENFTDWTLQKPMPMSVGQGGIELGLACWAFGDPEACLQGRRGAAGDWQGSVRMSGFDLERLRAWLPDGVTTQGRLNADAQFSGTALQITGGHFELGVEKPVIERQVGHAPLRFRPEPLVLRGMVTGRGAEARLVAEDAALASVRADVAVDGPLVLDRLAQLPLSGEVTLDLRNIGALQPVQGNVTDLRGRLDVALRLTGTARAPRLQAHGTLFDAGFSVPRLGIKVRSLNADAVSMDDNQIALNGRGVSGSGEIRLSGKATLSPKLDWPLKISLLGNRFLAADIPEAKVYLSPDLLIERKQGRFDLSGRLVIPEASIRIPDESGAIKPSRDVIIVDGDEPPDKQANPLETRVDVVLGDKITVNGPGYQARVDGAVTIEQTPGADAFGTGEIRIHNGQYSLYGVDLEVDGGRMVYTRSPMDNPNLDIRAVRKSDDVMAGAKLLGTLNKPNITLFADRPMSQTDILAYLVMGKPFDPLGQQGSGSAMRGAASALGGSAGSLLAKELSSRLGLGGLVDISMQGSLNAGGIAQGYGGSGPWGSTQSTALFLGKYLTPKIYVQYGMGLFQNAYVFRLRYDLTQRWKVQTETGEFSGGDILYQWEN
jgi:autotransporter translocation and assembly factor TamB